MFSRPVHIWFPCNIWPFQAWDLIFPEERNSFHGSTSPASGSDLEEGQTSHESWTAPKMWVKIG